MSAKHRHPAVANSPQPNKQPNRSEDPRAYRQHKIAWQVALLDLHGELFGWKKVNESDLCGTIHSRLRSLESMTWNEIERDGHNHPIEVHKIDARAQERLRELGYTYIDTMYQLHVCGKARVWGVREGVVFKVIWWDPDHKVYPVEKKHT